MKKSLAFLLALLMLVSLLPTAAFAEEAVEYQAPVYIDGEDVTQGISGWSKASCTEYTRVEKGEAERVTWNSGWYVVRGGTEAAPIKFSKGIEIKGDVSIILTDGSYLAAESEGNNGAPAAINVSEGNSLTIYSQSFGSAMGVLKATAILNCLDQYSTIGIQCGAGIGGDARCSSGAITINGGAVTAISKSEASYARLGAGIGGGAGGSGSDITINGGTVEARSIASGINSVSGAGIGGGASYLEGNTLICGNGSDITINGGNVTAVSELKNAVGTNKCEAEEGPGAGIGGGYGGSGSDITINGGVVDARSICGLDTDTIYYNDDNSLYLLAGKLNLLKEGEYEEYAHYDADHVPEYLEGREAIRNSIIQMIGRCKIVWEGYIAKAKVGGTLIAGAGIGAGTAPIDPLGDQIISKKDTGDTFDGAPISELCAAAIGSDICINGGEVTAESRLVLDGVELENSDNKVYKFGTGIGNGYGEPIDRSVIFSCFTYMGWDWDRWIQRSYSQYSVGQKTFTCAGSLADGMGGDPILGPALMYDSKSIDLDTVERILKSANVYNTETKEYTYEDDEYKIEYFIYGESESDTIYYLHKIGDALPDKDEFTMEKPYAVELSGNAERQVYVGTPTDNKPVTPEDNKLTVTDRYVHIVYSESTPSDGGDNLLHNFLAKIIAFYNAFISFFSKLNWVVCK